MLIQRARGKAFTFSVHQYLHINLMLQRCGAFTNASAAYG
jgi:hypothetical protein